MRTDMLPERAAITVEEAAALLGISRGSAYEAARRYEATRGAEGLPVLRIGRRLVVPLARFDAYLGGEGR